MLDPFALHTSGARSAGGAASQVQTPPPSPSSNLATTLPDQGQGPFGTVAASAMISNALPSGPPRLASLAGSSIVSRTISSAPPPSAPPLSHDPFQTVVEDKSGFGSSVNSFGQSQGLAHGTITKQHSNLGVAAGGRTATSQAPPSLAALTSYNPYRTVLTDQKDYSRMVSSVDQTASFGQSQTSSFGQSERFVDSTTIQKYGSGQGASQTPAIMYDQPLLMQPAHGVQRYGSLQPLALKTLESGSERPRRRRINSVAVIVAVIVPWMIFSTVFVAMSFSIHYHQPLVSLVVTLMGLAVVIWSGYAAMSERDETVDPKPSHDSKWYAFIFATCLFAWTLAVVSGEANFYTNMQPFYDVQNLNTYSAVDPSQAQGQQLMDAGRVLFSADAKLDLQKAMGFRNKDRYCVAPITVSRGNESSLPLATYDFWAVGINCCSGNQADFHCGEFSNPNAHGGLRLMQEEARPFFRLAVQQAEAAYGIKAAHPLFFTWMQDPIMEVNAYQEEGLKYCLMGVFSHFSLQLFIVAVAVMMFSRLA